MPNVLAFPDTPYAGVEENPGLRAFKFVAGAGQYYSTTIPSSLVQLDNCTVIVLHKPATSSGARMLLGDATGGVNTNMYVRQQNLAYRFAADYSTTDLVYNTVNAIVLNEWNWVAVIRNLAGGGAGTRIRGWYAQGLLGRWQALSFSAPTEPVGSLVNNAGFVLNTGGSATLSNVGYDGLVALVAVIKRPLTIGEIEDFRQDPLSWREEAELFLRPGHFGPVLRDEGKSKSGPWTATGSPPGWAGTGVNDFWYPDVATVDNVEILGTLSQQLVTSVAATGSVELRGTLSQSLVTSVSATGSVELRGVLNQALVTNITADGTALSAVTGTLSQALVTNLAATGSVELRGSLSQTLSTVSTATGSVELRGSLSQALVTTLTASGTATSSVTGTLSQALVTSLSATGSVELRGSASNVLSALVFATGSVELRGSVSKTLVINVTASGSVELRGSLSSSVQTSVSASGIVGVFNQYSTRMTAVDGRVMKFVPKNSAAIQLTPKRNVT